MKIKRCKLCRVELKDSHECNYLHLKYNVRRLIDIVEAQDKELDEAKRENNRLKRRIKHSNKILN